jgi:hypothetical protein
MGSKSKDNGAIISKEKRVPYPHASALHRRMLESKKDAAARLISIVILMRRSQKSALNDRHVHHTRERPDIEIARQPARLPSGRWEPGSSRQDCRRAAYRGASHAK